MATPSVSMWAASDSRASEPATKAVIASTTTKVAVSASATHSRPTFRAAVRRRASPWSWPACRRGRGPSPAFSPPLEAGLRRPAIMRIMLNSERGAGRARGRRRVVRLRRRGGARPRRPRGARRGVRRARGPERIGQVDAAADPARPARAAGGAGRRCSASRPPISATAGGSGTCRSGRASRPISPPPSRRWSPPAAWPSRDGGSAGARADREAVDHALESVALTDHRRKRLHELSGGQQQRAR